MKAGTAARLFRAVVLMAVLLISAIPVLTAVSDMGSEPIALRTESTYELKYMDEDTLADNLREAVSGLEGCTVGYGDASLEVDGSNCDEVARMIASSGAETATVYGPDGERLKQESVTYRNDVVIGGRMGVTIPGRVSDVSDMNIRVRLFSTDGKVDIASDSVPTDIEGEIGGTFLIPLVVYNVAGAYGCDIGASIGLEYEKLVKVDALSRSESLDYGYWMSSDLSALTIRGCVASGIGTGSVGNATISYTYDDGWCMTLSCEGRLSDALGSGMEDGCIEVTTNGDSYTMGAELSETFVSLVRMLEEAAA